ncbi:TonB-dependent receptor plug domain-containing protein [Sphingomonas naphthae]|uniref:TonB-dependent receptor plug domain-containing protein n=1 Tax=Sphingomonas naphthae TaxID=1813468 RepID=A0ABY7TJB3_9SPHN|nr:TonB-dependent receptor plug domain-containing protein [Sphingomonas naphthae]WCT73041.1 TonB-dependent receptor plug domain-containing protein [Sphingomonas naphthae]
MADTRPAFAKAPAAPQHGAARRRRLPLSAALLCCTAIAAPAWSQTTTASAEAAQDEEIVVTGQLDALPNKDVGTIFGFNKTLVDTPRSASTISKEQIERFGITDIYDLVAQAPGTFTNSFFGVGGALDIRGTPGEVYFRGVRRLDNPGNYPTPIGASDRIDIVRGPASPIYGPSKTGGYMNFVPLSARVKGGALMSGPEGEISYTRGSWDKNVLKAQLRGPAKIGGSEFGYSLYAEIEDSGSYYRNMSTNQTILQGAFDNQLTDTVRIEFGGMYQKYDGQQNGGWNRLTQALVDNGTYITGTARPLDTSGDGQISQGEFNRVGVFNPFGSFACGGGSPFAASFTNACFTSTYPYLSLQNVGTTTLSRKNVLTGETDVLKNKAWTGYFDTIFEPGDDLEIKNQFFYDGYHNLNENAYGFSQFHKSWVIEDKIVASKTVTSDLGKFSFQLSPSIRYTKFLHGDDFNYEFFHRVDLTQGYTALSDRLLSTECDCNYTNYAKGHFTDYGFAGLTDLDFDFGLDLVLGARYDSIHVTSRNNPAKLEIAPAVVAAKGDKGAWSWNGSVSYKLPFGLVPYVTLSKQSVVITGQGAEIYPADVVGGTFVSASKLREAGIKGSFLNNKLYAAVSVYKQKRTDFNIQSITVNQAVETKGVEAEFRWSVDKHFLVTGAYTHTNVYNLTALNDGTLFSFFGIQDLVNVTNPALYLGGQPIGLVPIPNKNASRRAGIPENLYSLTATYSFDNGLAFSGSVVKVDSVFSGQSQAVKLPAYTLLDLGASFQTGSWLFRGTVKNVTNETYFRANFTELFGSTIVLPERPRSFQASVIYKF